MRQDNIDLLRDPATGDCLEAAGNALRNPVTGTLYPIRDGIPLFLQKVSGRNLKYQKMYDRLAGAYDVVERLYRFFVRKHDLRRRWMAELEVQPGARVLEVSVGTGANLRYLPRDSEVFGVDLSWGMLRRCSGNLRRWSIAAELFQAEAEHLPFGDHIFDCVFHVGGINFFNDKAAAIREMIRVAKPGTKILIADETEKVVRGQYQRNPLTARYFEPGSEAVACPIDLVPAEATEVGARTLLKGRLYCLTFRTAAAQPALTPQRQ